MLKTETNTTAIWKRVLNAFRHSAHRARPGRTGALVVRRITAAFEHGQWWITDLDTGAQWSVNDARGGSAVDGFDFEQVSRGEEE